MTGTGVQSTKVGDSSFVVEFFDEKPDPAGKPNYNVINTDYDSYAIVYSCEDIIPGYISFDYFWILGREMQMSDSTILPLVDMVKNLLPEYGFFQNHMMTHQSDWCSYDERPYDEDRKDEDEPKDEK
mmetsp:Transcript_11542/g.15594  ORF Transcript_11542/g.15594 Transcript_11542/m.15594 type:complete len:127 (+) Transcript_11542:274-654(+)